MRLHLFEWNDAAFAPAALRDAIVESLTLLLRWGRMLRGAVEPFRRFVDETGRDRVLDLCAGAGGPAAILVDEIRRAGGAPPRFVLTDLYPRVEAWEALRAGGREDALLVCERPVDATRIEDDGEGRRALPRIIINAFHHFRPETAGAILRDAVESGAPIFIAEVMVRNPLRLVSIAPAGVPAALLNPFFARRHRLARALLTWVLPAMALAGPWDAFVSCLRVYTKAELHALVAPFGDRFRWEHGTFRFAPFGKGSWFAGLPRR